MKKIKTTWKAAIIYSVVLGLICAIGGFAVSFIECGVPVPIHHPETVEIDSQTIINHPAYTDLNERFKVVTKKYKSMKTANDLLEKENYEIYGILEATIAYEGGTYESEGFIEEPGIVTGFNAKPFGGFKWWYYTNTQLLKTTHPPYSLTLVQTHHFNSTTKALAITTHIDDKDLVITNSTYDVDLNTLFARPWYSNLSVTSEAMLDPAFNGNGFFAVGGNYDIDRKHTIGMRYMRTSDKDNITGVAYSWHPWGM